MTCKQRLDTDQVVQIKYFNSTTKVSKIATTPKKKRKNINYSINAFCILKSRVYSKTTIQRTLKVVCVAYHLKCVSIEHQGKLELQRHFLWNMTILNAKKLQGSDPYFVEKGSDVKKRVSIAVVKVTGSLSLTFSYLKIKATIIRYVYFCVPWISIN